MKFLCSCWCRRRPHPYFKSQCSTVSEPNFKLELSVSIWRSALAPQCGELSMHLNSQFRNAHISFEWCASHEFNVKPVLSAVCHASRALPNWSLVARSTEVLRYPNRTQTPTHQCGPGPQCSAQSQGRSGGKKEMNNAAEAQLQGQGGWMCLLLPLRAWSPHSVFGLLEAGGYVLQSKHLGAFPWHHREVGPWKRLHSFIRKQLFWLRIIAWKGLNSAGWEGQVPRPTAARGWQCGEKVQSQLLPCCAAWQARPCQHLEGTRASLCVQQSHLCCSWRWSYT